jgi:hypothetical protein
MGVRMRTCKHIEKPIVCWSLAIGIVALVATGCKDDDECDNNRDCGVNQICVSHQCKASSTTPTDSGTPGDTATVDTGTSGGTDSTTSSDSDNDTVVCVTAPFLENAETCTSDCDCYSRHCANGFCCTGGTCCATAANCPTQICNSASCTGSVCMYSPASFPCGDTFTVGDQACGGGDVCNGVGGCVRLNTDCGAYAAGVAVACSETGASACYTDCTVANESTHCASGYHCSGGSCMVTSDGLDNGAACTAGNQCASGYCDARGFCCVEGLCCEGNGDCDVDNTFCNGVFQCRDNVCQMDRPVPACESNVCNTQECDEANRTCIDGPNPCATESSVCNMKTCRVLDGDTFACMDNYSENGKECDDGDPCNGTADGCLFGECIPAGVHLSACFDSDPCTTDTCTLSGDTVVCSNDPVGEGGACTDEFSCFGPDGTCQMNAKGNLECVASEDVCATNGICTVSHCDESFTPAGNSADCRTDSFTDYVYLACGESVALTSSQFMFRTYFNYNSVCNPAGTAYTGMESQVNLALNTNTTSATVAVESIQPAGYAMPSLFLFSIAPCNESECLAGGEGILIFNVTDDNPHVIVLDSVTEPFAPEGVTLSLTCTP